MYVRYSFRRPLSAKQFLLPKHGVICSSRLTIKGQVAIPVDVGLSESLDTGVALLKGRQQLALAAAAFLSTAGATKDIALLVAAARGAARAVCALGAITAESQYGRKGSECQNKNGGGLHFDRLG